MSTLTNILSLLIYLTGYLLPAPWREIVTTTGAFALSGAITNGLAIYMLFEKVPFLAGTGVIPAKFQEFRASIHKMLVSQFFTQEKMHDFLNKNNIVNGSIDLTTVLDQVKYDELFQQLKEVVLASPLGSLLGMFGGSQALDVLQPPFEERVRTSLNKLAQNPEMKEKILLAMKDSIKLDRLQSAIDSLIHDQLALWTPQMVKEMVEDIIRKHLGWLVVWGGVLGGLMGTITALLKLYLGN